MEKNLENKYSATLNILNDGISKISSLEEQLEEETNMKLYCLYKGIGILCFDTKDELNEYCSLKNLSPKGMFTIEYIDNFEGKDDVIKEIIGNEKLYLVKKDDEQYEVYCEERSKITNRPIWQSVYGNISDMYMEFKKRGIAFNGDINKKSKNKEYIKKYRS